MKSSKVFAAIAIALLVTVSLTAAPLQQAPPPGQAPERGGGPAGGQQQQQTFTGQLAKVDIAAKEITVKNGDKEMVFTWIDSTQITGADGGAQGLTGKAGETLKVTYQSRGGANLASKIEVQEDKK